MQGSSFGDAFIGLFCFASVLGSIWGVIALCGSRSSCPACRQWYARKKMGETLLSQAKGRATVTRSGRAGWWQLGQGVPHYSTGSASWEEQIEVLRQVWLVQYKCRHCGHLWGEEEARALQDF